MSYGIHLLAESLKLTSRNAKLRLIMTAQNITAGGDPLGENFVLDEEDEPPQRWADITVEDDRWFSLSGLLSFIPKLVADALAEAGFSPEMHTVSIALLSDAEVQALNRLFRGKDSPTNVLSFPAIRSPDLPTSGDGSVFLGDVALAYETTMSEAAAENRPPLHHAAHLVVHGVLHLAGFDHQEESDAERMEDLERAALARSGIPDPYGDAPAGRNVQFSS